MQRVFFDEVNAATVRVLAAEGCEVVIPRSQGCCGALMLHAGLEADAAQMARRFIDAFEAEAADVDTIVINAAGCGSTLKEYGYLLRDDPVYAERASALARKCKDISELLDELEPLASRHPVPLRIAYHDACHLQHAQGVSAEPRRVLQTIPGLELCEIPEGGICCGSAGVYNLLEPDTAGDLGDRKAHHIMTTAADAVVSSNPGCLMQSCESDGAGGTADPHVSPGRTCRCVHSRTPTVSRVVAHSGARPDRNRVPGDNVDGTKTRVVPSILQAADWRS